MNVDLAGVAFVALSSVLAASAAVVAFARDARRGPFGIAGVAGGVAGLFVLLGADALAATELFVASGTAVVLFFLTSARALSVGSAQSIPPPPAQAPDAGAVTASRRRAGRAAGPLALALVAIAVNTQWSVANKLALSPTAPSSARLGHAWLGEHALAFELLGVVLLTSIVGALAVLRSAAGPGAP